MDLEELLKENYAGLQNYTIIPKLFSFIDDYKSEITTHPLFIKRVTKVAEHIIAFDNTLFLPRQLETLYAMSLDAIHQLQTQPESIQSPTHILTMASHLYAHQGHFAWELYRHHGREARWLGKAQTAFKQAKQLLAYHDTPKANEYKAWLDYHAGNAMTSQALAEQNLRFAKKASRYLTRCKAYQERTNNKSLEPIIPLIQQKQQLLSPLLKKRLTKKQRLQNY